MLPRSFRFKYKSPFFAARMKLVINFFHLVFGQVSINFGGSVVTV